MNSDIFPWQASAVSRVLEFSLGMGPRLLSHVSRKSHTRYSVKLLPFGGSCLMKGEDGDDMTPGAFGTKKVWQRILIVAAGRFLTLSLLFCLRRSSSGQPGMTPLCRNI